MSCYAMHACYEFSDIVSDPVAAGSIGWFNTGFEIRIWTLSEGQIVQTKLYRKKIIMLCFWFLEFDKIFGPCGVESWGPCRVETYKRWACVLSSYPVNAWVRIQTRIRDQKKPESGSAKLISKQKCFVLPLWIFFPLPWHWHKIVSKLSLPPKI